MDQTAINDAKRRTDLGAWDRRLAHDLERIDEKKEARARERERVIAAEQARMAAFKKRGGRRRQILTKP